MALRNIISLICNLAVFVLTFLSLAEFFLRGGKANMQVKDTRCFEYFTVDSNVLAATAAAIMLVFNVIALISGVYEMPYWVMVLKFVGTCAVALTFFVVMLMLAPYAGYRYMLEGCSLYMHLINPVAAMLSFMFADFGGRLGPMSLVYALIPVVIYGAVYFIMVVGIGKEKGGWEDFYGFNKGGRWYVSAPLVLGMSFVIAFLIRLVHNLAAA
ncbi:MAG: hypothetical protein IK064_05275 [Clostridia bacterium]|nr:hypothetical protein [Clostridia bacterium]